MRRTVLNARLFMQRLRRLGDCLSVRFDMTGTNSRLRRRACSCIAARDQKDICANARDLGDPRARFPFTSERRQHRRNNRFGVETSCFVHLLGTSLIDEPIGQNHCTDL